MPRTTTPTNPGDDDLPPEPDDLGKAKYEEREGARVVVRKARRILREVVTGKRRGERLAKAKPDKRKRRKADRYKP